MNVAHIEEQSFIYGPGCRFVIWTQGCSIRCKGCWNEAMWDFIPKIELSASQLFDKISQYKDSIDGITILGGEPLDQYDEILLLLQLCVKAGLSTMLFTGYEIREITEKGMESVIDVLDILITGRYEEKNRTVNHQWIGSTNQTILFLTDNYKNYKIIDSNYLEIALENDGALTILGFPHAPDSIL